MIDVNASQEVDNMETLLEALESEQEMPEENSFLDFNEPKILDDWTYRQLQFKKYGYAVSNSPDAY